MIRRDRCFPRPLAMRYRSADKGHDFVQQEIRIALALRPKDGRMHRPVWQILFGAVFLRIVDTNNNQGRNFVFGDQSSSRFVDLPVDSDVCRRGVKQVLPVIEIENRIVAAIVFRLVVSGGTQTRSKRVLRKIRALKFMQA